MIAYLNGNRVNDVHFHQGGGSGDGGNIFAEIGYSETPQIVQDGIDYAKEIKDNWDASVTSLKNKFSGNTDLVYFPVVDTSNVTNMASMFAYSAIQHLPSNFNTSKVTDMDSMFKSCSSLIALDLDNWDTSNVTNMVSMFASAGTENVQCSDLNTSKVTNMASMFAYSSIKDLNIKKWDTSNVTNFIGVFEGMKNIEILDLSGWKTSNVKAVRNMFRGMSKIKSIDITGWDTSNVTSWCEYQQGCIISSNKELEKIDGYFDLSQCDRFTYSSSSIYGCEKLRKLELRNLGKHSKLTSVSFFSTSYTDTMRSWGEDTEEIPDARQSLVDTLLTYSFDRATAGYSTCTITLHANTKARLTEDEIAQITAKGFTIA